ncbi:MAG: glycosyltransferase family 39 protein [Verrucomicrobia bacterium]|nr:glycosyltransferase family 39 protein [Verrucomicrobiota bacterium]
MRTVLPSFLALLTAAPARARLALFAASGVAAVAVGFLLVSPARAEKLIVAGGYYYIAAVFAAFLFWGCRVAAARRDVWQAWLRRPGWVAVAVLAATAFAVWSDSFRHKVLFDEYVLQGTAWHLHATKEVGTPIRAFDFAGTWLAIDAFLDKRPYFFTFLVSLLHDLTGYRLENAFALNVGCALVCLGLMSWVVRTLTGRRGPALLAVALLGTLPLFGQNATGASMELHNLTMIVVVLVAGILYLRAPDDDRLALLVLATVLLAQSRYESVLFVGPIAVVILLGWRKCGRVLLPWPAVVAPLLLVPYAWHSRIVDTKPVLWQLREGDTARFGLQYLAGNLEGARNFFFAVSPGQPNSIYLTLLGLAGLIGAAVAGVRWWRRPAADRPGIPPAVPVLVLIGLGITANLAMLMFYYWSRFDEPITARFALPFCLLLVVGAAWLVRQLESARFPATRFAALGLAGWMLVLGAPAFARSLYTSQNLVMREIEWELDEVRQRPGPVLVITSKATMPYLLHRISAINTPVARARGPQIAWHMRQGTFREVLVAQVVRPTSAQGDAGVDPEDELPPEFRLEPLDRKRFGMRWIRLSRLVAVETPPAAD